MKTKFILINFLIGSMLFVVFSANAQVTTSPYTLFGAGQVMDNGFGFSKALGGTGIGMESKMNLNNLNPASYSGIDSLSFIFEVGTYAKFTRFKSEDVTNKKFDGNIRYLAMGFRVTPWWAASLGAVPYSSVGYNITSTDHIEGELTPFNKNYAGNGGINQFYISNALSVGKHLALGINTSYVLGSVVQTESAPTIDNFNGYTLKKTNYINSFIIDYGLLLKTTIGGLNYNLGLVYGDKQDLNSSSELKFGTSSDTITIRSDKTNYLMPQRYGAGFSISKGRGFQIGIDYSKEMWSAAKFNNNYLETRDEERYSIGLEYCPHKYVREQGFRTWYYRLGAYYKPTYLLIDNTSVNTKAITFGIGIPLKKNLTMVNISAEIGQTGTTKNGLIQENYFLLHLNLNMHDIWFQKPRYD